jgi:tRNA dimethylallyltransferase
LILISGCTATGKTELAIKVCQLLPQSEIISVDSRQIYRYMDLGTAKPTLKERKGVPHHFIDCAYPTEDINAGNFAKRAWIIIDQMRVRGIVPVLVGGSGLYWQAIINGFYNQHSNEKKHRPFLIERMQKFGLKKLYSELEKVDPIGSKRISNHDSKRILRALEVFYEDKIPISQRWLDNNSSHLKTYVPKLMISIQRPRKMVYERINNRVDKMVELGLVDEVKNILSMYPKQKLPAIDTIGYREVLPFINGEVDLLSVVDQIKQNSRRFAKRQITLLTKDRRFKELNVENFGIDGCANRIVEQYKRLDPSNLF